MLRAAVAQPHESVRGEALRKRGGNITNTPDWRSTKRAAPNEHKTKQNQKWAPARAPTAATSDPQNARAHRRRGRGKGKARGRGKARAGQPRDFVPEVVKIDKASALRLKGKQITGTDAMGGGYRMARVPHGTDTGCWYYEVHIDKDKVASTDAAYRVGFSRTRRPICRVRVAWTGIRLGYRNI